MLTVSFGSAASSDTYSLVTNIGNYGVSQSELSESLLGIKRSYDEIAKVHSIKSDIYNLHVTVDDFFYVEGELKKDERRIIKRNSYVISLYYIASIDEPLNLTSPDKRNYIENVIMFGLRNDDLFVRNQAVEASRVARNNKLLPELYNIVINSDELGQKISAIISIYENGSLEAKGLLLKLYHLEEEKKLKIKIREYIDWLD